MSKFLDFLKRNRTFLFWPFVACLLFAPTLGLYSVLPSPDSAPYYRLFERCYVIDDLLAKTQSIAPHDLVRLCLPPLAIHDLTYLVDTLLIAFGFAWFLRGRGAGRLPSLFGGGVLAFAGYSFSLIAAGHRGYFFMGPYVVFTFAFLVHALASGRKLLYALAGCCAAWVIRFGPDLAPAYLAIAALYALWLLGHGIATKTTGVPARQTLLGVLCGVVAFGLTAAPSIRHTLTDYVAHRTSQIEQASPMAHAADATPSPEAKAEAEAEAAREKWIFATNWSLPPEETLEFIAPCYLGIQSADPRMRYWGRLGRTDGWEEHHQGFFNFRQHTVYLGAIPVLLALFALVAYCAAKRRPAEHERPGYVTDVPFWFGVGLVALLLAFGRYAPFYQFFYKIPYMSFLRAPVKFVRIVEFATAALAASGLALFLARETSDKLRKIFGGLAAAAMVAVLLDLHAIQAAPARFTAILGQLGASQLQSQAVSQATAALWHAILGCGLVALLAFLVAFRTCKARVAAAILMAAVGLDLYLVDSAFITIDIPDVPRAQGRISPMDIRPFLADNALTDAIEAEKRPAGAVTCHIAQEPPRPLRESVRRHNFWYHPRQGIDHQGFLRASGNDATRMWELTGSPIAFLPLALARSVPRDRIDLLSLQRLTPDGIAETKAIDQNTYAIVRVKNALPFARLYADWTASDETNWMRDVAGKMGSGHDETLVVAADDLPAPDRSAPAGRADIHAVRFQDGAYKTRISTEAKTAQVLHLQQGYSPDTVAWVDGRRTPVFKAGYFGIGLLVPAGSHEIVVAPAWHPAMALFSSCIMILFLAGCVLAARTVPRTEPSPETEA